MKKNIRLMMTCQGGSNSVTLLEEIKRAMKDFNIYCAGTHADPYRLLCSNANVNYLVSPVKNERKYIREALKIARKEKIDLIIPNSDDEAYVFSKHANKFKARTLLPDAKVMKRVQDKYVFSQIMEKYGIPVAKTRAINSLKNIKQNLKEISAGERFWIRVRKGAGSVAATWLDSAEHAVTWINLWRDMNKTKISDFTLSEFLPGRDFAVQTIWHQGKLLNAKIAERLGYYDAKTRISGMASTPSVARTLNHREAVDVCIQAVRDICSEFDCQPNGVFELDMKENKKGVACITEMNVGRFPMINAIFNKTGKNHAAELFVRSALGMPVKKIKNPYDFEPGILMVRGLDVKATFCHEKKMKQFKRVS